ncbi:MAG: hypothetical protein JNL39_04660 [Opitutaceae bacterium]|nr:hypothetical protein [Opitutaceae bacterium]
MHLLLFIAVIAVTVAVVLVIDAPRRRALAADAEFSSRPLPPAHLSAQGMEATCEIHFRDPRPPHAIQFELERELMLLLPPAVEGDTLLFRAASRVYSSPHAFTLRFEAALPSTNAYSFRAVMTLDGKTSAEREASAKSLASWFRLWTRHFQPADAVPPGTGSHELYRTLVTQALNAEAHLGTVAAVQQAIVAGLRAGGTYSTAHKEGGTVIRYSWGHFQRADYGEWSTSERFVSETVFLAFLRKFFDWHTSQHTYPERVPDLVAWKLMLRLLEPKR